MVKLKEEWLRFIREAIDSSDVEVIEREGRALVPHCADAGVEHYLCALAYVARVPHVGCWSCNKDKEVFGWVRVLDACYAGVLPEEARSRDRHAERCFAKYGVVSEIIGVTWTVECFNEEFRRTNLRLAT